MKILFHNNTINYRGTTVAMTDYAKYNQSILGNESVICYNESLDGNDQHVINELKKQYSVVTHTGNIDEVVDANNIDLAYFIRAGNKEYLPSNCKTAVHAVFQLYEPHGDRYAYVSKWLADKMNHPLYVPHMVDMPSPTASYRRLLGIGNHMTVIGRYGGYDTFNVPFVYGVIEQLLASRNDYVFLFAGTKPWIEHPRVIFLNEIHNMQSKSNFINTCDAMLHARIDGESFGLSIAEFLSQNKPVMTWNGGNDMNHLELLSGSGLIYNNSEELTYMLQNFRERRETWADRVLAYNPSNVIKLFEQVFIT